MKLRRSVLLTTVALLIIVIMANCARRTPTTARRVSPPALRDAIVSRLYAGPGASPAGRSRNRRKVRSSNVSVHRSRTVPSSASSKSAAGSPGSPRCRPPTTR